MYMIVLLWDLIYPLPHYSIGPIYFCQIVVDDTDNQTKVLFWENIWSDIGSDDQMTMTLLERLKMVIKGSQIVLQKRTRFNNIE